MLNKYGRIITSVVLALIISPELLAEKIPESRDEADHVVTAKVEAVYTRTKIIDPDSFKEKRIEYIIELDVMEVHRGEEAKAGKRFYVHCFQRDDSELAPGASPPPGMSGHLEIPKEGQVIKAFARYAHHTNNGLYPRWFDIVKDVKDGKK